MRKLIFILIFVLYNPVWVSAQGPSILPSDSAYNADTWNGSTLSPTQNAVRDKIVSMEASAFTNPMDSAGDIIIGGALGAATRLPLGTAYQLLMTNSGATAPAWTSTLGATGTRLTKGWFTDIESTNYPSVGGVGIDTIFAAVPVSEAFGSGWNSDTGAPEKDDVYDYLHLLDTDDDGDIDTIDATIWAEKQSYDAQLADLAAGILTLFAHTTDTTTIGTPVDGKIYAFTNSSDGGADDPCDVDGTVPYLALYDGANWKAFFDKDMVLQIASVASLTFADANASPDAVGELIYDNTVAGISDGAFAWYDDDAIRYFVDLATLPSDDDYVVAYDADADGFYMKADAGSGAAGTLTTLKEATSQVGGADIVTIDFGAGFDLAEDPDTEINITFDPTEVTVWDLGGATSLEIPNSDDPDVDANGEISLDTDGWLRAYNTTNPATAQMGIPLTETIQVTIIKPNDLDDAERDMLNIWSNETGMSFIVTKWSGWSEDDDTSLNIEEYDADGTSNNATVDAVEIATGSGPYTGTDSTITGATIEAGHVIALDFDDTDAPDYVKISITGYYNGDVN